MFGFGMFGKTPTNIIPILAGVVIAARIARTTYREYILIALFGTALAPLVSLVAAELGLPPTLGIPAAAIAGLVVGVILAALFGTTLAPLVGNFGIGTGIVAGALHPAIVMRSGGWHAGIGLYTNGLAGGLTATLLVALIERVHSVRPADRTRLERARKRQQR